ncbi:protamine P1 protein, partial [Toxoplasma gondii RUB]
MDGLQVCWVHQEVEDESEDDEDEETQLLPGSLRPFEAAGFHSSRQFAAVAAQERSEEAIWSSGLPPQSASSSSEETHPHRNKQIHSCITGKTRSVPSSRQHTASPFLSPSSTSLSSSVAPPDSSFSSSLSSPRLSSSPVALSSEASSSAFPSEASSSSAFPSEASSSAFSSEASSSSAFSSEASSSSVFHSEASSSASSSSILSSPPPLLSASSPLLKSECRSEPRVLFPSSVLPAVRLPPLPSDRLSKVCSLVSQLSDSSTTTAASRSPEQEVSPPCPPAFRRLATSAYNSYLPSSFSISALSRCSSVSPPSSSSSQTSSSFSSSSSSSLSSSSSFSSTSSSPSSSSFSATSFSTRSSSFSVHGGSLCSPSPLGCAGFSESLCLSPRCSREPPGSELFNLLDDLLESGVVCEFDPPSPNKALREKGEDSSPFSSDVSSPSSPLKSFLSSPRLRHSASTALPRDSLRSSAASPSSPLQAPSSYSSLSSSSASSSSSSFASSSPPTLPPSSSSSPPSSSASSVSFSTPSSSSPNSRFSSSFPRGFSSPSTVSERHPVSTALSCPRSASSASAAATNSVLPLSENARSLFVSPSLSDLADVMAVDFEDVDSGPAPSCSSSSCSSRASFSFSSLSHSSPSPLPASAYCSRPVLRHSAKDTAERRRKDAAESELRRGEDDRTEPHKTWMPERGDAVKEANRTPAQELRHSAEAHQPDTEEISSHFLAFFDDSIPLNHGVHPAEHADRGLTPTSKPEMESLPDVASSSPSPAHLSFTT